jgi:8-hydroxy-5-deazaflavin:NADPH oxidoreductase
MRIGIIGSGIVGQTLGTALAHGGHSVALGTRDPRKRAEKKGMGTSLDDWLEIAGAGARVVTFADAAKHGEVIINATAGNVSVEALQLAGAVHLAAKIVIDVSNPLDFSKGMPPTLSVCNTDSVGERIQRTFPDVKVVKSLNTVTTALMVAPESVGGGDHQIYVGGNDGAAKDAVVRYLGEWFGWKKECIIDLGDISTSRGTEMFLALWIRLMARLGTPMFNFRIVR